MDEGDEDEEKEREAVKEPLPLALSILRLCFCMCACVWCEPVRAGDARGRTMKGFGGVVVGLKEEQATRRVQLVLALRTQNADRSLGLSLTLHLS